MIRLYVRDTRGKFCKHDGRKKNQIVYIKNFDTGEVKILKKNVNKKKLKKLKKKLDKVFNNKTFMGIKLVKYEKKFKIKKIPLIISKPYILKKDPDNIRFRGYEKCGVDEYEKILSIFFSIRDKTIELGGYVFVITNRLQVVFEDGDVGDFYLTTEKFLADVGDEFCKRVCEELYNIANNRFKEFRRDSKAKKAFITFDYRILVKNVKV